MEVTDADKLFENVRKATRLMYEFQKRMQGTMFHLKSVLALKPDARIEINKLYSYAPRQSKADGETQLQPGNWAWDYIYPQAMEYYLGEKQIGELCLKVSAIQLADDGWFVATRKGDDTNILRTETYADVKDSTSWILFVMELTPKPIEQAARLNRYEDFYKWMSNEETVISEVTDYSSNLLVMKFPLQQIMSEKAIDSILKIISERVFNITGVSILS